MGALSLFPCLVVIIITPFAAREPYSAAEAASFNTVIDAISEDAMEERAPTVELSAKYGFSSRARADYDQLNTNQYYELYWEAMRNYRMDNGGCAIFISLFGGNHNYAVCCT